MMGQSGVGEAGAEAHEADAEAHQAREAEDEARKARKEAEDEIGRTSAEAVEENNRCMDCGVVVARDQYVRTNKPLCTMCKIADYGWSPGDETRVILQEQENLIRRRKAYRLKRAKALRLEREALRFPLPPNMAVNAEAEVQEGSLMKEESHELAVLLEEAANLSLKEDMHRAALLKLKTCLAMAEKNGDTEFTAQVHLWVIFCHASLFEVICVMLWRRDSSFILTI